MWPIAAVAVLIAFAGTLLVLNLMPPEKAVDQRVERLYDSQSPQFRRSMGVLLGPAIVPGNKVETLVNGREIFPAMLEAIARAKQSITFETYIYWEGAVGDAFARALTERARAGVRVHVLLDAVGAAKMKESMLADMRRDGVEIEHYHPLRWYHLGRMNNRTHRKTLVVDGRVGFTGGVGIADKWDGQAEDSEHWRDTHFRVEGPVVAQMQATFLDNWIQVRGEVLHGERYFPAQESAGSARAQMFMSSPTGGSDSMHLMYLLAITSASTSIDLASAYFVPDKLARDALVAAAKRGVRVRILLPGPIIDADIVRRASRADWGPLLEAGIAIHEYQPTMFHCKVMVVDQRMVSVGSTNFDNRSFRLNDESNLNVYDEAFARAQTAIIERDLAQSRQVTLAEWQARPWHEKVIEYTASLLSFQL
ncbi:MAG: cardiolipin synthase [Betaproteobacteria bacterium]